MPPSVRIAAFFCMEHNQMGTLVKKSRQHDKWEHTIIIAKGNNLNNTEILKRTLGGVVI